MTARRVALWAALVAGAVFLDGLVGAAVVLVVAAVLVAGAPRQVLGGLGVVALFGALVAQLALGVPSPSEVSPDLVSRSLLPHHLTFVGLVLVGAWAVLDLVPHRAPAQEAPSAPTAAPVPRAAGWALVAVVAVGALAVIWAVGQT